MNNYICKRNKNNNIIMGLGLTQKTLQELQNGLQWIMSISDKNGKPHSVIVFGLIDDFKDNIIAIEELFNLAMERFMEEEAKHN